MPEASSAESGVPGEDMSDAGERISAPGAPPAPPGGSSAPVDSGCVLLGGPLGTSSRVSVSSSLSRLPKFWSLAV